MNLKFKIGWLGLFCAVLQGREVSTPRSYGLGVENIEETFAKLSVPDRLYKDKWIQIIGTDRVARTYKVRRGDTLWNIAGKELSNPFLWRKLWQVNPTLTNPHDVSVGRVLAYYQDENEDDVPTIRIPLVKLVPERKAMDLDSDVIAIQRYKDKILPRILLLGDDEVLGEITGAYTEANILSEHSELYISLKNKEVQPGQLFAVARTERELYDDDNDRYVGNYTRLLGLLRIVTVGKDLLRAEITTIYHPIRRGDKVFAAPKPIERARRAVAPDALEARIIAAEDENRTEHGQGELLILNRGQQDGMKAGFRYRVTRDTDPNKKSTEGVAPSSKADLQILSTTSMGSLALILRNTEPVKVGELALPAQQFADPLPTPKRRPITIELN